MLTKSLSKKGYFKMAKKTITVKEIKLCIGAILDLPGDARLARHLALKTNFSVSEARATLLTHAEDQSKAASLSTRLPAALPATKGVTAKQRGEADARAAVALGFAS
jgi:hypothetical protein